MAPWKIGQHGQQKHFEVKLDVKPKKRGLEEKFRPEAEAESEAGKKGARKKFWGEADLKLKKIRVEKKFWPKAKQGVSRKNFDLKQASNLHPPP